MKDYLFQSGSNSLCRYISPQDFQHPEMVTDGKEKICPGTIWHVIIVSCTSDKKCYLSVMNMTDVWE